MSDYIDKVDIEGTQYDIQDTATKQTAEQNTQEIEDIKTSNDYSLPEVNTGKKWIDGELIYRKCVLATNNFTSLIPLPSGLDTLVSVNAVQFQLSGNIVLFPYSGNTVSNYDGFIFNGFYNKSQNSFAPQIGASLVSLIDKIVWIFEYTKSA